MAAADVEAVKEGVGDAGIAGIDRKAVDAAGGQAGVAQGEAIAAVVQGDEDAALLGADVELIAGVGSKPQGGDIIRAGRQDAARGIPVVGAIIGFEDLVRPVKQLILGLPVLIGRLDRIDGQGQEDGSLDVGQPEPGDGGSVGSLSAVAV